MFFKIASVLAVLAAVDKVIADDLEGFEVCSGVFGPECQRSECMLQEVGHLKDGKLDYDAMKKTHEEFFKDQPEMIVMMEEVLKECSEEDLKKFPDKLCLAQKTQICIALNAITKCPTWNKEDETCQKIAENTQLCLEALEKMKN